MSKVSEGDDHLQDNENDPFDSWEGIIFKRLIDMMRWHPRLRKDQFCTWMHDYCVVRIPPGNYDNPSSHKVHFLYHVLFEDGVDCMCIVPSLRNGETIALLQPDKNVAISAIA